MLTKPCEHRQQRLEQRKRQPTLIYTQSQPQDDPGEVYQAATTARSGVWPSWNSHKAVCEVERVAPACFGISYRFSPP